MCLACRGALPKRGSVEIALCLAEERRPETGRLPAPTRSRWSARPRASQPSAPRSLSPAHSGQGANACRIRGNSLAADRQCIRPASGDVPAPARLNWHRTHARDRAFFQAGLFFRPGSSSGMRRNAPGRCGAELWRTFRVSIGMRTGVSHVCLLIRMGGGRRPALQRAGSGRSRTSRRQDGGRAGRRNQCRTAPRRPEDKPRLRDGPRR